MSRRPISIHAVTMRAAAIVLAAVLSMLLAAGSADAANQKQASSLYRQVLKAKKVRTGWTGSVAKCRVGKESAASLGATRRTVNAVRKFAGLKPVRFDSKHNRSALAAALIMRANNALNHYPPRNWKCYSNLGANGAGISNLAWGTSGAGAILAYMEDWGVPSLGHRLWIFNPQAKVMGSGSTPNTNALVVVDNRNGSGPLQANRAGWPAAGHFPHPWVPKTWSISLANWAYSGKPRVRITAAGKKVRTGAVRRLSDPSGGWTRVFAWKVPKLPAAAAKRKVRYRVELLKPGGSKVVVRYNVVTLPHRALTRG